MLRARPDAEGAKYDEENENVVRAEGFLEDVRSEVFNAGLAAAREVDPHSETERESNPCGAFDERVRERDAIGLRAEDDEVGCDRQRDERPENHPHHNRLSTQLAGSRRLLIGRTSLHCAAFHRESGLMIRT